MSQRKIRILITSVVLLFAYIIHKVPENSPVQHIPNTDLEYVKVVRVVDGDTIVVAKGMADVKVRMIGVNAPESVDPRRKVECMGKESSEYIKNMLSDAYVYLEKDESQGEYDKYNRLLRYVFLSTSTISVNEELIKNGFAHEYTYDTSYKYQLRFKQAEREARDSELGLWNSIRCGA
ncbi:MAG: thermonuclease family protein [Candidatus Taylorbacteria bacterium]|nr:thermonuclease family protein [Candidatus Taylorbacteria bacterium]